MRGCVDGAAEEEDKLAPDAPEDTSRSRNTCRSPAAILYGEYLAHGNSPFRTCALIHRHLAMSALASCAAGMMSFDVCTRQQSRNGKRDLLTKGAEGIVDGHPDRGIALTELRGCFCVMWVLHHTKQIMVNQNLPARVWTSPDADGWN